MKNFKIEKIVEHISNNIIVVIYGIISFVLELFSLTFFDCSVYIIYPVFPLLLWISILLALILLRNKRLKAVYSFFFFLVQCLLILGCNYLFLSNGTIFERSMLQQRNDAYATIEQFYLDSGLLFTCIFLLVSFLVFIIIYLRRCRRSGKLMVNYKKRNRFFMIIIDLVLVISLLLTPIIDGFINKSTSYESLLYKSGDSYQKLGISSNFIYEVLHGAHSGMVNTSNLSKLDSQIYSKRCDTSMYNGISKGNNLIMILAESLEWYPLKMYPKEVTEKIYPNLSKLVDGSVISNNFYSREKTDTAEALTLVGSNPTGKYVHDNFAENSYPYSLPSLFRQEAQAEGDKDVIIRSYHQNKGSFYNRSTAHKSFGFDKLVDIDAMKKFGVKDTWDSKQRERTLDSLTINAMKDQMFPTDHRFFSYWITFSTHGFYKKRKNLSEYYKKFDSLGVFPEGGQYDNYLRTYAAGVADLDKAVGIMFDNLNKKGLLDKTTIVMVADHNTYYNGLSNHVKKIDSHFKPELYRVPMIIYDQKLAAAMDASGKGRAISKFTTTSDVIPTVLDLFGIPAWQNLYLGSTIFNKDKESIIYSRAYNIFITDKYIGYSLKDLRYEALGTTKETKNDFKARAIEHLNKLDITDKIFYSNYFSDHKYKP